MITVNLCKACVAEHPQAAASELAGRILSFSSCARCGAPASTLGEHALTDVPFLKPLPKHQAKSCGALAPGVKP